MNRARWIPLALAWGVLVLCGLPALAITFSRALASTDLRAVRLAAFAPFGVGLYALCLVAVLVLVWLAAGQARMRLLVVTGVTALLLAVHLAWQVNMIAPGDTPRALMLFRSNRDAGLLLFAGLTLAGMMAR